MNNMSYVNPDGLRRSNRNSGIPQKPDSEPPSSGSDPPLIAANNDNLTPQVAVPKILTQTPSSNTSNDLSYDESSKRSVDPPATEQPIYTPFHLNNQNINQTPSNTINQVTSAMTTVPDKTTVTPNIQPSSTIDPSIVQLQQSLKELTTRIDTIQETTTSRFSTIQDEFLKTQNSLASILQNGLNDINKQRQEDFMKMTMAIRTHLPTETLSPTTSPKPPGTVSVPIQSNKSSTSSLGDPPTGPPSKRHSSPHSIRSNQPDPPECIQLTTPHRAYNRSSESPKTIPQSSTPTKSPQITPKTTTPSTNSILTENSQQSSTPSTVQKIIVESRKDPTNLIFPAFYGAKSYSQYRSFCLAHAQSNDYYNNITKNPTPNTLDFNENMTTSESRQLYMATFKSLGKEAQTLVSRDIAMTANGYALWTSLDDHFLRTANSIQSRDNLLAEYETATKAPNETFIQFLSRVEDKIEKLEFNGIKTGDFKTKAYKLLRALKMNHIFGDILMNFDMRSDWYSPDQTLRKIMVKAQIYHDEYVAIHGKSTPLRQQSPSPAPAPAPSPAPGPAPPRNPRNRPSLQNQNPPAPPPTDINRGPIPTEIQSLKCHLKNISNQTTELHALAREFNNTCPLHNNPRHKLIECFELGNICQELGIFNKFNSVREDLDLPSMLPKADRLSQMRTNNNGRNNNPPPCPAPSPAPRARRVDLSMDDRMQRLERLYTEQEEETTYDVNESSSNDNDTNTEINNYSLTSTLPQPLSPGQPTFQPKSILRCKTNSNITTTTPTFLSKQNYIRAVLDSGASHSMSSHKNLFESITPFPTDQQPHALLGDDKTSLPILGYGMMSYIIHGKSIRSMGYYVPNLGLTLLSIKQHIRYSGCMFHAEAQNSFMSFPTFDIYPTITNEIFIILRPYHSDDKSAYSFNEQTATEMNITQHQRVTNKKDIWSKQIKLRPTSVDAFLPPNKRVQFVETVQIKRLINEATLPQRATPGSIGYDVASPIQTVVNSGEIIKIPTGLSTSMPKGMYLRIAPRSSLASKHITVEGGVVDADYRGEIIVMLKNNSTVPFTIHTGQNIAQFIFEKAHTPYLQCVETLDSPTTRKGGFGSTNTPNTRIVRYHLQNRDILVLNTSRNSHYRIRRDTLVHNEPTNNPTNTITVTNLQDKSSDSSHILTMANHQLPANNTTPQSSTAPPLTPTASSAVPTATPKVVSMTEDVLLQSIGYRKTKSLINYLKSQSRPSIRIQKDKNPAIPEGSTATIRSKNRNTTPLEIPPNVGDVWHLDIGYGPRSAIGGVKYTLMAVDRHSRYKLVYGLKNLRSSLLKAMKQFLRDCGPKPKLLRTDFDHKIMGGDVAELLLQNNIPIQASPPYRQHQNGLVERHWQEVVAMARNWLRQSLLPSQFWYFAIKRACEVSNLLPTSHMQNPTTPHELVYKKPADYRQLFPMFSTAYIKQVREQGTGKNKWSSQSLKCIVVGQCPDSNGLLFYHPQSKQTLTCGDGYKFDTFSPSGIQFELKFDAGFVLSTESTMAALHRPPTHEEGTVGYIKSNDTHVKVNILSTPIDDDNENYVVQETDSGDIHELLAEQILDHNPDADPTTLTTTVPFPHLPWIQHDEKATLYLPDRMQHPKQGILKRKENGEWTFTPGRRNSTHPPMDLKDFATIAESMVNNRKLFEGWKSRSHVISARNVRATSNVLAHMISTRKVSAQNLKLMQAPTLLKHHTLDPDDQVIWNEAYKSEYEGLESIETWKTITEEEYQSIKHLSKGSLPTMAIATIKYDGNGNPDRAKYRIVALGNLDPHSWSKSECFAPVLSQFELRFLVALAAQNKCIPKTGDVNQAFCQSCLPDDEVYICKPPPGCPISPPNSYWKLKKTLYGLKRSPRHFYELAKKILLEIGLQQHPTSPCIFFGTLIPGEPPLYLGLYVDDFCYFSTSRAVEEKFETDFGNKIDTDFNGQIGYFLGINFDCKRHDDGNVSIHLSQEAFIENLCQLANLDNENVNPTRTPYKSGYPVDSIPYFDSQEPDKSNRIHTMQVFIGCLTWLSMSTRPDIATITNLLAKYTTKCTDAHITHVKHVIKYLKGTKSLGVSYHSKNLAKVEAHVQFPLDTITSLCDANWGPQDQSRPRDNETRQLELFKSRSLSGFLIYFNGPIHWVSKRQTVTARSSAEAEIYATDECTKCLQHLHQIISGLNLHQDLMPSPTTIYNDNAACVCWSGNMTTKGLRHIQIRENAIRESVQNNFILVKHIQGKLNLSDMFTKEDKDVGHFLTIRNLVMTDKHSYG
jgi:deoxyuridine 5'-triphosphate nucleotidohydrolase